MELWEKGLEDLTPEELEQALINLDQFLNEEEEKKMAKKVYEIIMETLGINSKEEANALRIKNRVTFATVDDFCKKYAEEHKQAETVETTATQHPACNVGEFIPLFEEPVVEEAQVAGAVTEEETHVVIPTGFVPFSNQAVAAMSKSVAANVGIVAHPALKNLANDSVKETAANVGVSLDKFNVKQEDIKRWQLLAIGNRIAAAQKAKYDKWEDRKNVYPPSPEEVLKMLYDPAVENDIYRTMIVSRKEIEKAAAKEKKQVTEATVSSCTKSNVASFKKDDIVIKVGDKDITMRIHASQIYASYVRGDIRMKDDSKPAVKFSWGINFKTGKPYDEIRAEKYDKVLKKVVQMRSYSIVDGQKVQGEEEKKNASVLNCVITKLKAMGLEPIANASINTWGQKGGK